MANIKAFKGILADQEWLNQIFEADQAELKDLVNQLESRDKRSFDADYVSRSNAKLNALVASAQYHLDTEEALYIYEQEDHAVKRRGIWSLTAVQDVLEGKILSHEATLAAKESDLRTYRSEIGLEARPVLLTYKPNSRINQILAEVVQNEAHAVFKHKGVINRIWKIVNAVRIAEIQAAFSQVSKSYIADGHHRMAAAVSLHQHHPQWISTLYVHTTDLKIAEFNRLILPEHPVQAAKLFDQLNKFFNISPVSNNQIYQPDRLHRMGLYLNGIWYQLDLKPDQYGIQQQNDVSILQDKILEPVFNITEPRSDEQLHCFSGHQWPDMFNLLSVCPEAILFTVFPVSIHQLINQAEKKIPFPPKSTYIEPKIPYGLILYAPEYEKIADHI